MTDQYDNTNRGAIWANQNRTKDTHPTHTGNINIDGVDYWLNGWARGKDEDPKRPAMRFSVRRKDEAPKREPSAPGPADDDIPF